MRIYFAGVPGGDQKQREEDLYILFGERWSRLISFFYQEQAEVTIQEIIKVNENLFCRQ